MVEKRWCSESGIYHNQGRLGIKGLSTKVRGLFEPSLLPSLGFSLLSTRFSVGWGLASFPLPGEVVLSLCLLLKSSLVIFDLFRHLQISTVIQIFWCFTIHLLRRQDKTSTLFDLCWCLHCWKEREILENVFLLI